MLGARLLPLLGGIAKLAGVGVIMAGVVQAFVMIRDDAMGLRTFLLDLWTRLVDRFEAIKVSLSPIAELFSPSGVIGDFFGTTVKTVIEAVGEAVEGIVSMAHLVTNLVRTYLVRDEEAKLMISEYGGRYNAAVAMTQQQMNIARNLRGWAEENRAAQRKARMEVPAARERQPYYDFRGSRFDIKQAFADVDPDRIAVAFANSLGAMGERRVQSAFAPLWSVS
jgi:hypothetical protein